jgi:radical SAM protein with 4Fe4S-binding SPASM domain
MFATFKNITRYKLRQYPYLRYWVKAAQKKYFDINRAELYRQEGLLFLEPDNDSNRSSIKREIPNGTNIEITNACNLNCLMCNTKLQERPNRLMEPEVFERIILELQATGINIAGLHTVGETFVYKDLETLLDIAQHHNFRVWISTNAQFPERIEEIYTRFPKMLNDIRISVDGATAKTFEHIRVGGSFAKVIESFEVIHQINEGKKNFRIGITLDSILNSETAYEIPLYFERFGKYLEPENMNFWVITGLSPDNSYFKDTFPYPNLIRSEVPCDIPFNNQHFTYDGKATLCCRDYNEEIVVGDIMTSSLKEIWDGEEAEKVREQHRKPETLNIKACQNCFGPHKFVENVINNFIHYLHLKRPIATKEEFGNAVTVLLERMDDAMTVHDKSALKRCVGDIFDAIDRGDKLRPERMKAEATVQASN